MKTYKVTFLKGEESWTTYVEATNRLDAKRRFLAQNMGTLVRVNKAITKYNGSATANTQE
ncbi:hypothetical protein ACS5NO_13065 [Larkinella sp. GY13]|uniref:hypothetical protein n=1 Tax=Larkinella sp. GY13 TaxID=3453720 RepID=UPI003EEBCFC3